MSAVALADVAATGDRAGVLDLLATMDDKARRAARKPLDAAWKDLTRADSREVRDAVTLAALGCCVTSAEAARALISLWRRQRDSSDWAGPQVDAFAGRDAGWLAEAGRRVAATVPVRRPNDWALSGHRNGELYRLARGLLWMAGAVPAADDGFVLEWALTKWRRKPEHTLADVVRPGWAPGEGTVAEAFRADPYTAVFLPLAFGITGFGTFLVHDWHWRPDLLALTETGELDRVTLIDRCVDGLVRGGRAVEMRGFQKLLDEVQPTEDELAERAADWAGLAGRAEMPSAGRAVESLRRLLDAGRLDIGLLTETSYAVLARPEKTLVRAHVKLVAEALRRTPGDAAALLPAIASAFGHDDTTVQEQAWRLAARHLATAGEAVRAQLADAL
ncbi:MAG TPA: DUF6493 family protein, partial [Actinoplanes sp.]|nr:DUF6493 family protein [Actinoplanes sp.]